MDTHPRPDRTPGGRRAGRGFALALLVLAAAAPRSEASGGFRLLDRWSSPSPGGMAIDAAGHVYVSDRDGGTVHVYDASGTLLRNVGMPGAGDGQLAYPGALAVGADGTLYVADEDNHRIAAFRDDGSYLGAETNQGLVPAGVAAWNTGVVTTWFALQADPVFYAPDLASSRPLTGLGLTFPHLLAAGASDLFVLEDRNAQSTVARVNPSFAVDLTGGAVFATPAADVSLAGMAARKGGGVVVAGSLLRTAAPFTRRSGVWRLDAGLAPDGAAGSDPAAFIELPELQSPAGVAVDAGDAVYVADGALSMVFRYADDDTPVEPTTWGRLKRLFEAP